MKACARKRVLNEIGGRIQLWIMPHVSLANFPGELLHIGMKLFAERNFILRQCRHLGNIFARHPHSEPPE